MTTLIALPIVGFLIGILVIAMGGGGGAIYVGVLTLGFGLSPGLAASTSLATIIPTAIAGTFLSAVIPEAVYRYIFGGFLTLIGLQMGLTAIRRRRGTTEGTKKRPRGARLGAGAAFGLAGGLMAGLMGVSGGGPIVAGLVVMGCTSLESIGTSVFVLVGVAAAGFAAHAGIGVVDWRLAALLGAGTVSGAFVGPFLLGKIDKRRLERILMPVLAALIAITGILLLVRR